MVSLNKALADYTLEDAIEDGRLKALERFSLDRNTLMSRGLKEGAILSLYQTLFVHSMGFNNCIRELVGNKSTIKSIWKAYAILLEYCSEGYFQTMVGELERDMIKN
jgi:hypothetical protein